MKVLRRLEGEKGRKERAHYRPKSHMG